MVYLDTEDGHAPILGHSLAMMRGNFRNITASEPSWQYKPYPTYKYSGIEWLGEIPAHWNAKKLKYVATCNDEALPDSTDPAFALDYVDIGSVDEFAGIIKRESMTFASAPSRARRVVRDGDIIISTVRTYLRAIAAIGNAAPNLVVSTGFAVIRPRKLVSAFAAYAFRAAYFVDAVVAKSVGVNYPAINCDELVSLAVVCPNLTEQRAIAEFLDRETGKIDALVARKERLIELLKEKRAALITQAVTKGLAPDVPMKDCGIDWLGEIPAHWEVKRLRFTVTKCENGIWGDEPDGKNDVVCIRVADFDRTTHQVKIDSPTWRAVAPQAVVARHLGSDDLLLEKSGGGEKQPVGVVVRNTYPGKAICSNFIARMPVARGCHVSYLTYLHAALYAARINLRSIKQNTGIQNLDSTSYLNEFVALPTRVEQADIAEFLDRETGKIDALVAKVREAIERLKELRAALISAAVTGKIDVREAVP